MRKSKYKEKLSNRETIIVILIIIIIAMNNNSNSTSPTEQIGQFLGKVAIENHKEFIEILLASKRCQPIRQGLFCR